jgi:tripartite ATP-independent transporter DctP family solute receptor
MRLNRRILSVVLISTMIISLTACKGTNSGNQATESGSQSGSMSAAETDTAGGNTAEYIFKVGHVQPADHPYHTGLVYMNKILQERTGGRVSLDIYPSSQLGAERELVESTQMGTIDMGLVTSPLANFDNSWYLFDIPGIFYTKEHAYEFLDGEQGQAMLDGLANINIKGLSFWETGFFNIFVDTKAIEKPQDVAGMTIRVMENDAYITYFSELGANPVPMAYSEVFTGIQNGTVDGTLIPIAAIYMNQFYMVAPYITRCENWYCPVTLLMSMDSWNSMPEDLQEIFQECANEAKDYMRQELTDTEEEQVAAMIKEGCTITEVDKDEWRELEADAVQKVKEQFIGTYVQQKTLDYIEEIGQKYR